MVEPWQGGSKQGDPYRVFTPFRRTASAQLRMPAPMPAPGRFPDVAALADAVAIDDLDLAPGVHWDEGFWLHWKPGEAGANAALAGFIEQAPADYAQSRDFPALVGTSRLSPHLHFGEISPWQIARSIRQLPEADDTYLRQLGWREFSNHVLHHYPKTTPRTCTHIGNTVPHGSGMVLGHTG